jgi:phosphatidate cytidylyltransferase
VLKKRIITAIILIPLVILAVFKLPFLPFILIMAALTAFGAWEWSNFLGWKPFMLRFFYVVMVLWLLMGVSAILAYYTLFIACVFWLFAAFWIIQYARYKTTFVNTMSMKAISGLLVLIPCWESFAILKAQSNGGSLILLLFLFVWVADTSAYFIGRRYGKHLLIPNVSPGKTIEGFIGALLTSVILGVGTALLCHLPANYWIFWILLVVVTTVYSVLGDLFESMMKRSVGLKDSGKLLPGHGGLLDRIDSLTAAAPIFTLGVLLLNSFHRSAG